MAKKRDGPSRTRQQLDQAMQKMEREQLLQSARRRLEIAMGGVKANEKKKYVEAVKSYHAYLKILEEVKGVPEGGLVPSHFNLDKEMGELLLLVGVYWDLTKIFDRTKSPEKYGEFRGYLDKFLLFSRNMPHERMCRDMLRKYLRREKPTHAKEFRDAYRAIGKDKCFVATALADTLDGETIPRLRAFRDEKLSRTPSGRAFIGVYYSVGPVLARVTDALPQAARQALGVSLDRLARRISLCLVVVLSLSLATASPLLAGSDPCGLLEPSACLKDADAKRAAGKLAEASRIAEFLCDRKNFDGCMLGSNIADQSGDHDRRMEFDRKACALGEPDGCYALAVDYVQKDSWAVAEELLGRACRNGGRAEICMFHETSLGVLAVQRKDKTAALEHLNRACAKGEQTACKLLKRVPPGRR